MDDDTGILHDTVIKELREVLAPVLKYAAYAEDFLDFTAYSILALLWNKDPLTDNIHHAHMGYPYRLRDADTTALTVFSMEQHQVEQESGPAIKELITRYTPQEFTCALIDSREHSPVGHRIAEYWNEAETIYGPNPNGYTVTFNENRQPFVQSL